MMLRFAFVLIAALALLALAGGAEPAAALHLLCWSEYVPPAVIDGFAKTAGVAVTLDTYGSNEQMLAKLREHPGYYDVVQPSGFYVESLARSGELAPLDFSRIPNARHLDPDYRGLPFDPQGQYSVPWLSGSVGIAVNTERVHEPIESFAEVFSGRYAGRIVVVDDPREMVAWALAALGKPIAEVSDAALQATAPLLRRWLPQVKVFDSDSPHTAMLDGRADLGIMWSGEAALLWKADHKFRYVLPARGAHRFVDSLAIPKAAPHQALAENFIDYCLDPAVSVLISNAYPYTNPNLAGRRLLTPDQLANPASYPPGAAKLPMLRNEGNSTGAVAGFVRKLREQLPKASLP